jgi:glycosyltransferase involved in cell wall biosynthesis
MATEEIAVAAIVVTHRRPTLATDVVRSLLEVEGFAPQDVYLVINGEGGLSDQVLQSSVNVIRLPHNPGPAGGFREGMIAAGAKGAEWFYLCEDDIALFNIPTPRVRRIVDEVTELERRGEGPVGAVVAYGRDLHPSTGHTTVHTVVGTTGYERVDAASWGASLVSSRVLPAGALPSDDYFFGYEDFDFWFQITNAGFRILVDRESSAASQESMSLEGRDEAFKGKRPLDVDEPWRAFYIARNYFILSKRHGDWRWMAAHLAYSGRRIQLAKTRAERTAIVSGLLAGVRGRTGRDDRFLREKGEAGAGVDSYDVLHVLPQDVSRGAQIFAQQLVDALDGPEVRHHLMTLFEAPQAVLKPDIRIDAPGSRLRALGLDPVCLWRLRKQLDRLKPAVVVAHGGEPLKYLALLKRRFALAYLAIGTVAPSARSGAQKSLYKWTVGKADLVLGVSEETLDELESLFDVPRSKLLFLANGRDPVPYDKPSRDREDKGEVRLVFVGHLTDSKRPGLFVRLVRELRANGLAVSGVVVGDGPLEDELRRISTEASVEVLGRRDDVPEILGSSDVFVFTSVPEGEGMPGVLIEAGMARLPVVSTDVPGATTVIKDGSTGIIVPVEDFGALLDAVTKLVLDPQLRQKMGSAARERSIEMFGLETVSQRWREVLQALADR